MRILISASGYPSADVPYAAFVQIIAHEITRQGHHVTVIAPQSITKAVLRRTPILPIKNKEVVGDTEVVILRPLTISFGSSILARLTNFFTRIAVCRAANRVPKPDIVYSHFWASGDNILGYVMRNNFQHYVASGEDVIDFDKSISPRRIMKLKHYTKGVICVSTKNMEESIQHGLTTKSRCKVFPNAIDPNVFHIKNKDAIRNSLGLKNTDFVVAFCGRFNYRKGASRVAEAIQSLKDSQIKSIFIGGLADNYNVEPHCSGIIFKGKLKHNQISYYLNAADIFVLPTIAEGCPNSVVEAMACGLPIISSDMPFNYDILNDSNSLLVNPLDVQEIASAITKLKNDHILLKRLQKGAIDTASELNIENRVSLILKFIADEPR